MLPTVRAELSHGFAQFVNHPAMGTAIPRQLAAPSACEGVAAEQFY